MLKAGARVLTLDQLEGIKVQRFAWMAAAGPFGLPAKAYCVDDGTCLPKCSMVRYCDA